MKISSTTNLVFPVAVTAILFLFAWQMIVKIGDLPLAVLPTPVQCFKAGLEHFSELAGATFVTGFAAVVGLTVATVIGSVFAIIVSQSKVLRAALFPYVLALQTVPIVAIAPLLIIWSGYTFRSVIIVTSIVSLFPITNSLVIGLTRIPQDPDDLFNIYGASRMQRMFRLQIPSSVNDFVTGLKTSSALSVIGAVIADFFVSSGTSLQGLGTLMTTWQTQIKTDALIAALFASAVLGFVIYGAVDLAARTLLARWTRN
jgi:NitT/TauT family transport system permease protein